jgi:hypothetical protein
MQICEQFNSLTFSLPNNKSVENMDASTGGKALSFMVCSRREPVSDHFDSMRDLTMSGLCLELTNFMVVLEIQ